MEELVGGRPDLNAGIYEVYRPLGVADGTTRGIMSYGKFDQVRGSLALGA